MAKTIMSKLSLTTVRRYQDRVGKLMASHHLNNVNCEYIKVGNLACAMFIPKDEIYKGVILYIHGGGYVSGNLDYAGGFASMLASKCNMRVFTVEYRLAPENPYPAALDDVMEAYGYLLSAGYEPSRIALCGESAGAGLCYALCQKLRDKGRTMPAGVIAISPWTDLTLSGESQEINKKIDPYITAEQLKYYADCYALGKSERSLTKSLTPEEELQIKRNPRISPLFDSCEKMPESIIFVGSDEILYDDAVMMHRRLTDAGCKSELVIAENLWHGYLLFDLPDRAGDFDKINKFLKRTIRARKSLAWMSLDNAAKLFPASRRRTWANIFRVSSTLNEEIDRDALRTALDITVRRFPALAVAIKDGFFWHYLEEIKEVPEIMDEKPYPTARMTLKDMRRCAFRVLVYKNRIAVEFFHALTDGTGALTFVKTLTAEYLYQKYNVKVPVCDGILDRLEEPDPEESEDGFLKYAGDYHASRKDTDAYRIDGKREPDGFRTNTTFLLESDYVREQARLRGVSVNVYLSAVLIEAARRIQEMRVSNPAKYMPIKLFIPINLRKMFPSKTTRNFIMYANVGINPRMGEYSFDDVCSIIVAQMKMQMTKRNLSSMIKTNVDSERNPILRIVPLFVKDIAIRIGFNLTGERKTCFVFSNLGNVNVPEEYSRYVKRMDFVLGSQAAAPYNVSLLGYGETMYLNVTRNAREPVLEKEIYKVLRELGVPHTVESNSR